MTDRISPEQIEQARKKLGLTIEQFALLLNVNSRTIQRWEKKDETGGLAITSGTTASEANLLSLLRIMDDEKAFEAFKQFKESLVGAKGALAPFGNMALNSVGSMLPLLGMLAGGVLANSIGPAAILALKNYLEKVNTTQNSTHE